MEQEKGKNLKGKIVETYSADMTRAISGGEGIYIKKIIEEQEKAEIEKANLSPESKRNKAFLIIGVILLGIAICLLGFYAIYKREASSVDVVPPFTPLIYLDNIEFMGVDDLNRDQITQTIYNESVMTGVKSGGIEGVYLTVGKKIIGFKQFLNLVAPEVDTKKMTFVNDNFLTGILNGEKRDVFLLIKTRSFVDIFDQMISWENTMFNDFHTIFNVDLNMNTKYLLTKDFEDGIVQNRNARILRDANGNIVLMYVYIDDTSVLITNSEQVAHEMQLRLSAGTIRK